MPTPNRAGGFSYTIGSATERRMVIVETSPGNRHHIREIDGIFYQANQYLDLQMDVTEQKIDKSSAERIKRGQALLADRENQAYPICHMLSVTDDLANVASAEFDLDQRQCQIHFPVSPDKQETIILPF